MGTVVWEAGRQDARGRPLDSKRTKEGPRQRDHVTEPGRCAGVDRTGQAAGAGGGLNGFNLRDMRLGGDTQRDLASANSWTKREPASVADVRGGYGYFTRNHTARVRVPMAVHR